MNAYTAETAVPDVSTPPLYNVAEQQSCSESDEQGVQHSTTALLHPSCTHAMTCSNLSLSHTLAQYSLLLSASQATTSLLSLYIEPIACVVCQQSVDSRKHA